MTSTSAFYSGEQAAIERKIDVSQGKYFQDQTVDFNDEYCIEQCIHWIKSADFKRVGLQFPDELMDKSVQVCEKLSQNIAALVFILGDTSYGSCCVDEVAAEHYNADCIIHYGRACLSLTQRLPVFYVFGQNSIDVENCAECFKSLFGDRNSHVIILYETSYSHCIDKLKTILSREYHQAVFSELNVHNQVGFVKDKKLPEPVSSDASSYIQVCHGGRVFCVPKHKKLEEYSIFYIGPESLTLTNLILTFSKNEFFSYNPVTMQGRKESVNVNKKLMKRFFLVEKAKDAHIVGIVMGTLGVANYIDIIDRLKKVIKLAGKKSYMFVVGKLNVAKLANFMEIDIFVLVACAENSLLDSAEFYKPVITPYEMELACNPNRSWTGDIVTDFRQLLPGHRDHVELPDHVEFQTDVSLVTGKMRNLGQDEISESSDQAIIPRNPALAVSELSAQSAGEHLLSRTWKGVEQKLGKSEVKKASEGRKGIAMEYSQEGI